MTGLAKIYIYTFILICALTSCSKTAQVADPEIEMAQPFIVLSADSSIQMQPVAISLEEHAELQGERVLPSNIVWTIVYKPEDQAVYSSSNSRQFNWTPEVTGLFNIKVTVFYSPDDIISASKELFIYDDFRLAYIGDYHFVKTYQWFGEYPKKDTTEYEGYIDIVKPSLTRIKIKCGDGEWNSHDYFATDLEFSDTSIHPFFVVIPRGRNYYGGEFISFDTVKLSGYSNPLGGTASWEIIGTKEK